MTLLLAVSVAVLAARPTRPKRDDIVQFLGLRAPHVVVAGFDRPSIYPSVRPESGETERHHLLRRLVGDPEQGSVGGAVLMALDKLGLTEELKPRITWVPTGGVVQDSVAKGEYELALGPYLSDMRNPGLDVVGALSPDAAPPVDVTGFISTNTRNAQAARALLDYLSSPEVAPVYRSAKMFAVADK